MQRYLDAIAGGDARTATAIDQAAVDEHVGASTDATAMRTDAVLAGAVRIDDVAVDPETTSVVHDGGGDERAVNFSFTLAGTSYTSSLPVGWNEDTGEWVLLDTVAQPLLVQAQMSRVETALIGFRVPGAVVEPPADPADAPTSWLMYPGVYTVTGDLDPALLTDPSLGVEREVAVDTGGAQPSLVYDVTALP